MPVNLSIKNVPDDIAEQLRARAAAHHRSLQGELMAIIEAAARPQPALTPLQILELARQLGIHSESSSVALIRADRDRDNSRD